MKERTIKVTVMAMLVAVSVVFVFIVHVPLIPVVSFLEYDPADIPILIGALAYGPAAGVLLTIAASAVQALTVSAQSGLFGFVMHVISTCVLTVTASIIYRRRKNAKSLTLGLFTGTIAMAAVMLVANHFITPLFITSDLSDASALAQNRAYIDTLLIPAILPFNLIKAGINSVITSVVFTMVKKYIPETDSADTSKGSKTE